MIAHVTDWKLAKKGEMGKQLQVMAEWRIFQRTLSRETLCGSNSVVECQLPKLDVAGSIPVSRSVITATYRVAVFVLCLFCTPVAWPVACLGRHMCLFHCSDLVLEDPSAEPPM